MDENLDLTGLASLIKSVTEKVSEISRATQDASQSAQQAAAGASRVAEATERAAGPTSQPATAATSNVAALAQSLADSRAKQQRRKDLNSIPTAILQGVASGNITDPAILSSIQELAGVPIETPDGVVDAEAVQSPTTRMERISNLFSQKAGSYARGMMTGRYSYTVGRVMSDLSGAIDGPGGGSPPSSGGPPGSGSPPGGPGAMGGEADGAAGALGIPVAIGLAAGQFIQHEIRQLTSKGVSAASPLMGNAEQGIAQGASQSAINMMGILSAPGEIANLPKNIMAWSEALLESQKRIAAFNGTIQMGVMEAERRGFIRDIQSGAATGGGTAKLSEGYESLLDELRPIKDSVTNDIAIALRTGVASLTWLVQGLKALNDWNLLIPVIPKMLQKLIDNTSKEEANASTNFDEWMNYWRGKPMAGQAPVKK